MKPFIVKRLRFRLKKFLAALHQFSPDGNPLPGISGDIVHHDNFDLSEDLSSDVGDEFGEIPADSLARLELGVPLFGYSRCSTETAPSTASTARRSKSQTSMTKLRHFRHRRQGRDSGKGDARSRWRLELEMMLEPNLLSDSLRRWVRSFLMSTALSNEATLALSRGPAPSVPGNIFSPQMPSAAGCRAFVAKKCCEEGGPFLSAKVALFLSAVNKRGCENTPRQCSIHRKLRKGSH